MSALGKFCLDSVDVKKKRDVSVSQLDVPSGHFYHFELPTLCIEEAAK